MRITAAELVQQRAGDLVRRTAVHHQPAQHGTEHHDQRQASKRAAEARLDRGHEFHQAKTFQDANEEGGQQQGHQAIDFVTDVEQQHEADPSSHDHDLPKSEVVHVEFLLPVARGEAVPSVLFAGCDCRRAEVETLQFVSQGGKQSTTCRQAFNRAVGNQRPPSTAT